MSEIETVQATLDVEIFVDCPNDNCGAFIDILKAKETNGHDHNDESALLQQVWPKHPITHDDFECEEVTCTECKTTFNVKGLDW